MLVMAVAVPLRYQVRFLIGPASSSIGMTNRPLVQAGNVKS
jgi:hypothetical protein